MSSILIFCLSMLSYMATWPSALSGPSRNLGADLNSRLWAVLCGVPGLSPASSGGRWTGSCPEISHLVGRSQPPVKRGQSSALSPIRTVYRATGASGWRRRWLHNLHTHISVQATAFTMTGIKNKPDPWAQSSVRILVNGVWRFRVKRFS